MAFLQQSSWYLIFSYSLRKENISTDNGQVTVDIGHSWPATNLPDSPPPPTLFT